MSDNKLHFWLVSAKASFFIPANAEAGRSAAVGYRETNIVVDTTTKRVNADTFDVIRQVFLMKCMEKYNLDPKTISDFLIQNISYLGLMSPKEYVGNTESPRIEAE